jgi:hypothetical protein
MHGAPLCRDKALKLIGICDITETAWVASPLPRFEMIY